MTVKGSGRGVVHELYRWNSGASWMAHPDETMRRASHALVPGDGVGEANGADESAVWVVEPVDADGLDDWLADLGTVAGVVVLASYHRRDAASVAARHDVPVYVPVFMDDVAADLASEGATVGRFAGEFADTGYELVEVADDSVWAEGALWNGETLVVMETLVTASHLTAPSERLAVTPFRRLNPPREVFAGLRPKRVLSGHGEGVFEDADAALADALGGARRRAPSYFANNLPTLLRATWVAVRT